jgi:hypothetical protein
MIWKQNQMIAVTTRKVKKKTKARMNPAFAHAQNVFWFIAWSLVVDRD